jgi:hypothetical protein
VLKTGMSPAEVSRRLEESVVALVTMFSMRLGNGEGAREMGGWCCGLGAEHGAALSYD